MPLVDYPDSDSDDADNGNAIPAEPSTAVAKPGLKRKSSDSAAQDALPPLPAAFHDLYSTNARVGTSDDPALHGGRKRALPHVEGNWPSHIYIEWVPAESQADILHALIQRVRDAIDTENGRLTKKRPAPKIIPSLQSELGAPLPLHVSLSRTLQIKTDDRDLFLDTLKSCLRRSSVRSFNFVFKSLKWVPNHERNRWFLVLSIQRPPQDEFNRLLGACNEATESCGHLGLYTGSVGDGPMEKPSEEHISKKQKGEVVVDTLDDRSDCFHISIAWNLEEPDRVWIDLIRALDIKDDVEKLKLKVDVVKARVGNVVHSIELGKSRIGTIFNGAALRSSP